MRRILHYFRPKTAYFGKIGGGGLSGIPPVFCAVFLQIPPKPITWRIFYNKPRKLPFLPDLML
ncbi:MAG: hypothetical protein HAW59_00680 [Betaproteobacteria bacterium]|nr:hypothetical protein [Betaproteobacteria bacterium]